MIEGSGSGGHKTNGFYVSGSATLVNIAQIKKLELLLELPPIYFVPDTSSVVESYSSIIALLVVVPFTTAYYAWDAYSRQHRHQSYSLQTALFPGVILCFVSPFRKLRKKKKIRYLFPFFVQDIRP
jgi:hypothetical protein